MPRKSTKKYIFTVGRRKSCVVTVKLFTGKGESLVNGQALTKYFHLAKGLKNVMSPFVSTKTEGKYYFEAKATGGGKVGQSDALKLAIARALDKLNEKYHPALKAEKLLTVDARVRQRRMIGTGGKSRRQKQSPKR